MTAPNTGPPIRLLTSRERRRRRRATVSAVAVGVVLAVTLTTVTLRLATRRGVDVHLGSETFRVGRADLLARRVQADHYPLLFQDLRDKSIDLFVDHPPSEGVTHGWRAIEAHAPGGPRRCQLSWSGTDYVDPCNGSRYPATGDGLRQFVVVVRDGVLFVDFRHPR